MEQIRTDGEGAVCQKPNKKKVTKSVTSNGELKEEGTAKGNFINSDKEKIDYNSGHDGNDDTKIIQVVPEMKQAKKPLPTSNSLEDQSVAEDGNSIDQNNISTEEEIENEEEESAGNKHCNNMTKEPTSENNGNGVNKQEKLDLRIEPADVCILAREAITIKIFERKRPVAPFLHNYAVDNRGHFPYYFL